MTKDEQIALRSGSIDPSAVLRTALEYIAESRDAGRHDGKPEPQPAYSDVEMWMKAQEALAAAPAQPQGDGDANVEAVRTKLLQRSERGIAKYGVTTERTDLSQADWLRHLQEELMDAAVYIEALMADKP